MLGVTIVILIAFEILAWRNTRDLKSPAVLFGVFWIVSLINLSTMELSKSVGEVALLVIGLGMVVFQIGYFIGTHVKIDHSTYTIAPNNRAMKLLITVLFILAVPVVIQYIGFIRSYGGSLYNAIRAAESNLRLPPLFDYYRKITQYLFFAFAIVYWKEPVEKRKTIRVYVLILFVVAMLSAISVPTRNSILFFGLPLLMCWYCTHHTNNKRIARTLLIAAIAFLVVFYIISTGKYWYLYSNSGVSRFTVIREELQTYLSGSIAAFSTTWKEHSFTRYGGNTFRFFIAIFDAIFGTSNAVPLVNEFATFSNGFRTNVFTFYDFYLRDFGIIYSLAIQFAVAIIHGVSYKKMQTGNPYSIYMFSMLSYPLVMQFFQDQYISLLSTWVQIIIVGVIVLKSRVFFRRSSAV
jgi:oligosaccharide repeat unit polymerase